tara:strand:+ start:1258 stop:1494 length:237 start_codon:yes stop_codon:yes gene_type:complete
MKKKTAEAIFEAADKQVLEDQAREAGEAMGREGDLDDHVRRTYLQRVRAQIFSELGVHLNEEQAINYCLSYTIDAKRR